VPAPACRTNTARSARLCELNVVEQAANVASTTIVQDAWAHGQELTVHGWIYGLSDGLLRTLKMSAEQAPRKPRRRSMPAAISGAQCRGATSVPW